MRKRDIVLRISQDTGIKQVVVKEIVQHALDLILESLKEGKRIELRNFGVFQVKRRKSRVGRNPKTGEVVPVPERKVVTFKPGLDMKKYIH
ncbi:MAG: integration host factor subunit beta [Candidatus Omnitrophica bacterium]|nr:integration host factor subunit beta [Candidatus Omnitrophota bacterium]MCF7877911.1 integration host factor subunit beta [Candidatus Omnitrophota bacterium]